MLAIVFNARLDLSHICMEGCVCVCAGKENIACTTGTACRLPHTTTRTTTALLYNKAQHASDTQTDRDGQRDRQRRTEGQRDKRGAGGQTVGLASATVHAPLHREQKLTGSGSKHVTRQLRQLAALNKFAVKIKRKCHEQNDRQVVSNSRQLAPRIRYRIRFGLVPLHCFCYSCCCCLLPAGRHFARAIERNFSLCGWKGEGVQCCQTAG